MYEYLTRHLVALKPQSYAGSDLKPGDQFVATPDDATYLIRCKRAEEVKGVPNEQQPVIVEAPVIATPVVEQPPVQEEEVPEAVEELAVDDAVVAVEEQNHDAPVVTTRRRGRPRRNS